MKNNMNAKVLEKYKILDRYSQHPADPAILVAPHDIDPYEVMHLVETGHVKAVMVAPPNREDFKHAASALSRKDVEYTIDACVPINPNDDKATTLLTTFPPLIQQQIERVRPFLNASEEMKKTRPTMSGFGREHRFPFFHTDPLVFHISIKGDALEFLCGEFTKEEQKLLKNIEQRERAPEGFNTDPKWQERISSAVHGDLVIFNRKFWHRSALSTDKDQLSLGIA